MTDNEIIRAWKWHILPELINGMKIYPAVVECSRILAENTLDLVNHQKAEIERLKMDLAKCSIRIDNLYETADEIKSEAIKEFAKRLKENCYTYSDICGYQSTVVDVNQIDNLVKEMTEDLKNDDTKNNISTFDGNRSIR